MFIINYVYITLINMLFRSLSPISCYVVCRWGNQPEISIIVGWILEGLLLANTHFRHRGREWHLLSSNWIKCRRCEFDETASRRAWHLQFRHVVQNDSLRDSTSCENDPFLWMRANVHRGEFMNGKDRYILFDYMTAEKLEHSRYVIYAPISA